MLLALSKLVSQSLCVHVSLYSYGTIMYSQVDIQLPSPPSHTSPPSLPPSLPSSVAVAAKETNDRLAVYEEETRFSIHCSAGFCHSLAIRFDQFTESLCLDVVPGMDLYWTSLVALLVFSLLTIPAAFFLASRFIDLVELGKSDQSGRIHLTSAILEETRAAVWLGATLAIDVWLVVVISRDEVFSGEFCQEAGPGCCATCVWAFGILFLILASFVGGVSRVYQGVIMYRIKSESAVCTCNTTGL